MKGDSDKPFSLDQVLQKTIKELQLHPEWRRHAVIADWENIVGPAIAQRSAVKKMEGELLIVAVEHPVWLQELNLLKPKFLKKIQEYYPESGIKNIRFVMK